jgi:hypothetical protein
MLYDNLNLSKEDRTELDRIVRVRDEARERAERDYADAMQSLLLKYGYDYKAEQEAAQRHVEEISANHWRGLGFHFQGIDGSIWPPLDDDGSQNDR